MSRINNQFSQVMRGVSQTGVQLATLALGLLVWGAMVDGGTVMAADNLDTNHMNNSSVDDYLWLEDIHGARAMDWVKAQNLKSTAMLQADSDYRKDYDALLKVLD